MLPDNEVVVVVHCFTEDIQDHNNQYSVSSISIVQPDLKSIQICGNENSLNDFVAPKPNAFLNS